MIPELALAIIAAAAIPVPDSLVLPMQGDTLTEAELTIFPPDEAKLPASYEIAWGDGDTMDWTVPSPVEYTRYHRYGRNGSYEVTVRVRDADGRISDWSEPVSINVTEPALKWVFPTFDPVVASPTLDDKGNVYFGDESGWFYSVDPSGRFRWGYQTNGAVYGAAAFFRGLLYFGSLDSNLYCLDTEGKLRWKTFLDDEIYTPPALGANGAVYVGTNAGTLVAVAPNGKVQWRYKTGDEISSSPSVGLNGLIYITSDSVYCVDARGRRRWTFGTPWGGYFFAPAVPALDGKVYVGNEDGTVYCVGPDGRQRWAAPIPDEDEIRTEVVVAPGETLYVGSDGYYLVRKAPGDVAEILYEADDVLTSTPAISAGGTVYFLSDDGYVYALSTSGRRVWEYEVAVEDKELYYTSSPVIAPDGTVYVGSWDGGLYAFTGDGPPARSLWPQYRHDAQHTGRLTKIPRK